MLHRLLVMAIFGLATIAEPVFAQTTATTPAQATSATDSDDPPQLSDNELASAALSLLNKQMGAKPTDRIPLLLRHQARCLAIFPEITKVGLIIAGKSGRGLVSCRHADSGLWGVPAFYNLTAGSIGLQAGIQTSSLLLLIVDESGIEKLLAENVSLSGDAGITAGPVGIEKGVTPGTSVLAYSRSKGVFAGLHMGATNITADKAANARAYGHDQSVNELLFKHPTTVGDLKELRDTLNRFAPLKPTS